MPARNAVLITGASSGLGRALALACARPGAVLHLSGRDPARLDAVAAEARARGAEAHPRVVDVADADALKLGQPDVFFSTPHYDGWPGVLVRLEAVSPEQLSELIEDAWRLQAAKRVVAAYDKGE